jgi:tetratricopeptide (TPR) repeat protein
VFVAGRVTTTVRAEGRPPADLEVMPHASALNAAFYDLRLYGAADWFITSAGVRGRYQADHERYGAECEFYRALDRRARRVATFVPHGGVVGPEIRVYRIGDQFREGSTSIDPRWWAASVPDAYRARFRSWQGGADGLPAVSPPLDPPAWLRSLEPVYARYVQSFVSELTTDLAVLGRDEAARDLARATLEIDPVDVEATLLYGTCSGRLGRWEDARAATERTLAAGKEAEAEPALVVLSARALEHTGDARAARRRLTRLLDRHDLPKDAAFAAEQMLASMRPAPVLADSLPIAADP